MCSWCGGNIQADPKEMLNFCSKECEEDYFEDVRARIEAEENRDITHQPLQTT
jgi:hypothetical protein